MFHYHVVGCRQLRSHDLLEEGYVTTLSGHPLRFSEREVSPGPSPDIVVHRLKPPPPPLSLPLQACVLSPCV